MITVNKNASACWFGFPDDIIKYLAKFYIICFFKDRNVVYIEGAVY